VLFRDIPKTIDDIVILSEGWNPASARVNIKHFKRMIGLLSEEARILLILRLFTYLYIRPFLRFAFLVFLILIRFYHSSHPEIISTRMNESFLIRSFWTNYYINPGFLSNSYYIRTQPGTPASLETRMHNHINMQVINAISNNTVYNQTVPKSNRAIQYIQLSNSRSQVVFANKPTEKRLLRPVITSINNTMMLVDFTTPIPSFRPTPSSVKKVDTKPKITSQITISEPVSSLPTNTKKPIQPIGNKNKIQKIKKIKKIKNTNFKVKTTRGYKLNSNDFIYGYINVDKRIAVIYDNGISYFYKLSKEFLDKYVDA
jgi:hypothetical protein